MRTLRSMAHFTFILGLSALGISIGPGELFSSDLSYTTALDSSLLARISTTNVYWGEIHGQEAPLHLNSQLR